MDDVAAHVYVYPIEPMGAPRQVRSDAWKPRPNVLRYRAFRDLVNLHGIEIKDGDAITFVLPVSESWSAKKKEKMIGTAHRHKPDLDNLLKGLMDAVWRDKTEGDEVLFWLGELRKEWGVTGSIKITRKIL